MIQKRMSGDITKIEPKIFLGFTPRQVIYSVVAFVAALLINKVFGFMTFELRGYIIMFVAAPLLACGWIKIQGLPFEKHMLILLKYSFSQKERVYENEE
jgi:hypothetical protein